MIEYPFSNVFICGYNIKFEMWKGKCENLNNYKAVYYSNSPDTIIHRKWYKIVLERFAPLFGLDVEVIGCNSLGYCAAKITGNDLNVQ